MTKKKSKDKQYTKEERAEHKAQVQRKKKLRELIEHDQFLDLYEEDEHEVPD